MITQTKSVFKETSTNAEKMQIGMVKYNKHMKTKSLNNTPRRNLTQCR